MNVPSAVFGEFVPNYDSCWDLGFVDFLISADACKQRCNILPGCNSFGYHVSRPNKRCHLCTRTTVRASVDCPTSETCSMWGLADEEDSSAASVRDNAISVASEVCSGNISPADALSAANDLNGIIQNINKGIYDNDQEFKTTHASALSLAADILAAEDNSCFSTFTGPYVDHSSTCTHGGVLFLQLRALLVHEDGNINRAFPISSRDGARRTLFNKNKIFVSDNGWLSDETLEAAQYFFDSLPDHVVTYGIRWDAPFTVMSVRKAYTCEENIGAEGLLRFTNRGFNIFHTQFSEATEQGFPNDTPEITKPADVIMTVIRHESGHQFDRARNRNQRLFNMFNQLKGKCTEDRDWLRKTNDFFQESPQEVMASQIGNQYFHSTSAQLRLAAKRLYPNDVFTDVPTNEQTTPPTPSPTTSPTPSPTTSPTPSPTTSPTPLPTPSPTTSPTPFPTPAPTNLPTPFSTPSPTNSPTPVPTTPESSPTTSVIIEGQACKINHNLGTHFSSPEQCAIAAKDNPNCSGYQIMWSAGYSHSWGCRCCSEIPTCEARDHDRYYATNANWSLHQFRANPCDDDAQTVLDQENRTCRRDYQKNLGKNFANPEECAIAARDDASCTGNQIMWSDEYNSSRGCRCCMAQCDIPDATFYGRNKNWDLYKFKQDPPCNSRALFTTDKHLTLPNKFILANNAKETENNYDSTTAVSPLKRQLRSNITPILLKQQEQEQQQHRALVTYDMENPSLAKHSCANNHNLGTDFANRDECAAKALETPACTGGEIMWSGYSYAWGCRCCTAPPECSTSEEMYDYSPSWDLFRYRDDIESEPCLGTSLPLAWFLFNVDFMSNDGNTVNFYEDQTGDDVVDGYATPICVNLERDSSLRIISMSVPGCGDIAFGYGDDGVVNSVDKKALNCVVDPDAESVC